MERRHYRFYGRVQGVGFRYRAQYTASHLGLTGWVANLWDGSVEMEAQGDPPRWTGCCTSCAPAAGGS